MLHVDNDGGANQVKIVVVCRDVFGRVFLFLTNVFECFVMYLS
jgi:hypothetical protein